MLSILLPLIILIALSKIIWHPRFPWTARIVILAGWAIYLTFVTGLGIYVRPFFTSMDEWHVIANNHDFYYRGTGAFINGSDVMTNQHVVEGCHFLAVRDKDKVYLGTVVATDDRNGFFSDNPEIGNDVAVIHTSETAHPSVSFRQRPLVIGQTLTSPEYTSSPGSFSRRTGKLLTNEHYMTFSGPTRKGNSGSPVYDEDGYLVGIQHSASASFNPLARGYGIGTHEYIIAKFLQAHNIRYTVAPVEAKPIIDTDEFEKSFAVGVLCGH